ncbi:MAG: SsrA-binding protein SmpB [Spirochaetaceae bacterium]|nr:SsrA-binding protein SmpB [Spirochaetaceae bacterium]MDT8297996.1 SsrA-binding protein SmpB [Spirochaetaceae bacterium]
MAAKKKKGKGTPGILGDNRKARHLYTIEDSLECGIALHGTEVKSIKSAHFNFTDAFVEVRDQELWLRNFHITPYSHGGVFNHESDRPRRLLAHKKEILKLERRVNEKGVTLIPLKFYLVKGRVKVEVGLCRGKKLHDKRDSIKQRDIQRDMDREYKTR